MSDKIKHKKQNKKIPFNRVPGLWTFGIGIFTESFCAVFERDHAQTQFAQTHLADKMQIMTNRRRNEQDDEWKNPCLIRIRLAPVGAPHCTYVY